MQSKQKEEAEDEYIPEVRTAAPQFNTDTTILVNVMKKG
jgi:hypothetical protein